MAGVRGREKPLSRDVTRCAAALCSSCHRSHRRDPAVPPQQVWQSESWCDTAAWTPQHPELRTRSSELLPSGAGLGAGSQPHGAAGGIKTSFPIYLWDYSFLSGRSGAQGGWRRFNPRDKRKPSKRLIAGLCILCSVGAHVTAAMPSARHSPLPCIIHQPRVWLGRALVGYSWGSYLQAELR